jgi:hypothetical protein
MPNPVDIRQKVEELARVSKDLEGNVKMQAHAANFTAAEQLRKRVSELTETQNQLMAELVELHPDKKKQQRFGDLHNAVEELKPQIKACKEIEELRRLEKSLEQTVEDYVHCFQTIVAELMGAPPPQGPVFS